MSFDPIETEITNETGSNIRASVPAVTSSGNSTTAPLVANGVFTGAWEESKDFSVISILINADQPSADQGVRLQYSTDGISVHDEDVYSYLPEDIGNGKFLTLAPEAAFFRVKYTNGATGQASFTFQTIYRTVYIKPSSHRLAEVLTDEADAELVKAVITGRRPDGTYADVSLSQVGRVRISNEPATNPDGTDAVDITATGTVTGNSSVDTTYLVPNGKVLLIQNLNGGGSPSTGGSVIELFDDPNGNATGMTLLRVAFIPEVGGGNFNFDLNFSITGDGTRRILVRRTRLGGGTARIAAFWSGFVEQ